MLIETSSTGRLFGITRAQHGAVPFEAIGQYSGDNRVKLQEIADLLTDIRSGTQGEHKIGGSDELSAGDEVAGEEQLDQIEEIDGFDVIPDPSYRTIARELSEHLDSLEQRIRGGQFDLIVGSRRIGAGPDSDSDSDDDGEANKEPPSPGSPRPTVRRFGEPYFDLLGGAEYNIEKLVSLKVLNDKILALKVPVPPNFYQRDLKSRPLIPGITQFLSIWDAIALLLWYPRNRGIGTPDQLTRWLYATDKFQAAQPGGNAWALFDVAGRYNLYKAVESMFLSLDRAFWNYKETRRTMFWNVFTKDHYEFAPVWERSQQVLDTLLFYRDRLNDLKLKLEELPPLVPVPISEVLRGPAPGVP
ncbi:hypothetical protein TWF281_003075 [Arthrobotrys megalospora]